MKSRYPRKTMCLALLVGFIAMDGCSPPPPPPPPQQVVYSGPKATPGTCAASFVGNGVNWSPGTSPPSMEEQDLWSQINLHRNKANLNSLKWNDGAAGVANLHSTDMMQKGYVAIVSPTGVDVFQRLSCSTPAINFASGDVFAAGITPSATAMFNAIAGNPSFAPALVRNTSTQIGIGFVSGYWTIIIW